MALPFEPVPLPDELVAITATEDTVSATTFLAPVMVISARRPFLILPTSALPTEVCTW